jgi:hypothetical protein
MGAAEWVNAWDSVGALPNRGEDRATSLTCVYALARTLPWYASRPPRITDHLDQQHENGSKRNAHSNERIQLRQIFISYPVTD